MSSIKVAPQPRFSEEDLKQYYVDAPSMTKTKRDEALNGYCQYIRTARPSLLSTIEYILHKLPEEYDFKTQLTLTFQTKIKQNQIDEELAKMRKIQIYQQIAKLKQNRQRLIVLLVPLIFVIILALATWDNSANIKNEFSGNLTVNEQEEKTPKKTQESFNSSSAESEINFKGQLLAPSSSNLATLILSIFMIGGLFVLLIYYTGLGCLWRGIIQEQIVTLQQQQDKITLWFNIESWNQQK